MSVLKKRLTLISINTTPKHEKEINKQLRSNCDGSQQNLIYLFLFLNFLYFNCFTLYIKSKEEGKGQESIQSNTTPDPGHGSGK